MRNLSCRRETLDGKTFQRQRFFPGERDTMPLLDGILDNNGQQDGILDNNGGMHRLLRAG